MKVLRCDNFDRDYIPDVLEAGPGLSVQEARALAKSLNDKADPMGPYFYRVVEDDYRLKDAEP